MRVFILLLLFFVVSCSDRVVYREAPIERERVIVRERSGLGNIVAAGIVANAISGNRRTVINKTVVVKNQYRKKKHKKRRKRRRSRKRR